MHQKFTALLQNSINVASILGASVTGRRDKRAGYTKVGVRPLMIKGKLCYQLSSFSDTQVFHENIEGESLLPRLGQLLASAFKQAVVFTEEADYHILSGKEGHITILKKQPTHASSSKIAAKDKDPSKGFFSVTSLDHNRAKRYLLAEGTPIPFLVKLGVMGTDGKILPKKYDKFRQINRFLEMVEDVMCHLEEKQKIHIVDFGCGKAYLTFAMYHYLTHIRKMQVELVGIDRKAEVVEECQALAVGLGYEGLHFWIGDIDKYVTKTAVDMMVSLHACNTATDAALAKAIEWQAKVILAAPCCQHELFDQISHPLLAPILKHGALRERLAAVATDAVRAQILEILGYKTCVMEFIETEHTPKNLLIRAVYGGHKKSPQAISEYAQLVQSWGIDHALSRILRDKGILD